MAKFDMPALEHDVGLAQCDERVAVGPIVFAVILISVYIV